jgi:hypothetical protein
MQHILRHPNIHQVSASASKFEVGELKAVQSQIPNVVDDAVIDMFSRGHGGREDGSLTLGIGVAL